MTNIKFYFSKKVGGFAGLRRMLFRSFRTIRIFLTFFRFQLNSGEAECDTENSTFNKWSLCWSFISRCFSVPPHCIGLWKEIFSTLKFPILRQWRELKRVASFLFAKLWNLPVDQISFTTSLSFRLAKLENSPKTSGISHRHRLDSIHEHRDFPKRNFYLINTIKIITLMHKPKPHKELITFE